MKTELEINLPSLQVVCEGRIITNNFKEFESAVEGILGRIKTNLESEEDFAQAEKIVKACKSAESELSRVQKEVLSQTGDVNELVDRISTFGTRFKKTRNELERQIKTAKEDRKKQILTEHYKDLLNFIDNCNKALYPYRLPFDLSEKDISEAGYSKKTLPTFEKAIRDAVKHHKEVFAKVLQDYQEKLKIFDNPAYHNYRDLFADMGDLLTYPADQFIQTIDSRIQSHQARERQIQAEQQAVQQPTPQSTSNPAPQFQTTEPEILHGGYSEQNLQDRACDPLDNMEDIPFPEEQSSGTNLPQQPQNIRNPELSPQDQELVNQWYALKVQAEQILQNAENLKNQLVTKLFNPSSGQIQNIEMAFGYKLQLDPKLKFNINVPAYTQLIPNLRKVGLNPDLLVEWEPVVNQQEYLKLSPSERAIFLECVDSIGFGDIKLEVVAP